MGGRRDLHHLQIQQLGDANCVPGEGWGLAMVQQIFRGGGDEPNQTNMRVQIRTAHRCFSMVSHHEEGSGSPKSWTSPRCARYKHRKGSCCSYLGSPFRTCVIRKLSEIDCFSEKAEYVFVAQVLRKSVPKQIITLCDLAPLFWIR